MDKKTEENIGRILKAINECEVLVEPGCECARLRARSLRLLYRIEGPWPQCHDPLEYLAYGPGQHPVLVIGYDLDESEPAMVDRLSEIKM